MKLYMKAGIGVVAVAATGAVVYGGYRMYKKMRAMEAASASPSFNTQGGVNPLDAAATARAVAARRGRSVSGGIADNITPGVNPGVNDNIPATPVNSRPSLSPEIEGSGGPVRGGAGGLNLLH